MLLINHREKPINGGDLKSAVIHYWLWTPPLGVALTLAIDNATFREIVRR